MEETTAEPLKKTSLNARHRALGARMVPFGGWDMPVEYAGIVSAHMAVPPRAGRFAVTHMGEHKRERGALEPHGRNRAGRQGCPRRGAARQHERRVAAQRRAGPIRRPDYAR